MDISRYSVLIVDDFATMRRIVSNQLREAGLAHFSEAEDGAEALHTLGNCNFQIVASDRNMPR